MSDPYSVHCPTCSAPAGSRCASFHKELDFAHWSRRRFARARQARRARLIATRPTVPSGTAFGGGGPSPRD